MTRRRWPDQHGLAALALYVAGAAVLLAALVSAAAASAYYAIVEAPSLGAGIGATLAASLMAFTGLVAVIAVAWLARSHPTRALVAAAALFVAIRVLAALALDGTLEGWSAYNRLAIGWTLGAPPIANWPMGYPILLGEAYRLLGVGRTAPEVLNLLLSGVGVALLAAWVHALAGRAAGATAVAVLAVAPSQTLFVLFAGTETLFTTLLLAAVLFLTVALASMRGDVRRRRVLVYAAASGIALGLALWVRPTALVIGPFFAVLPLLLSRSRLGATLTLVFVLGFGAMLSPIVAVNRVHLDRWSPSTSLFTGWQLYIGFNQESMGRWNDADRQRVNLAVPEFRDFQLVHEYERGRFDPETLRRAAERDAAALRLAIERIREDGIRLPIILPFKVFFAWGPADAPVRFMTGLPTDPLVATLLSQFWWMAVLAGAIWWHVRHGRDDPLPGLIVSAAVVPVAIGLLLLEVLPRYHEYVVPLIAGLAAISLTRQLPPRPSDLDREPDA
jgi:4-amino-4-deoxy-L-arabinose transferase-like glycosyltransferase